MNNKLALYCRSGFEKECAAEITAKAAEKEIFGFARVKEDSGYVLFECYQLEDADRLAKEIPFRELIFARQMLVVGELLKDLPPEDRVTPIVGMLQGVITNGGELRVEVPDTNESKELTKFCRKLTVPLRSAMREARVLGKKENAQRPVVHVFFIAPGCCYVGYSYSNNNSPFYMGIPRLKFPSDAPSRSTLKLEEAFHVFIPADEWEERLASGMYAVDLGACPGGWTYQLVQRSMMVDAIDNGPMAPSLMMTGQVTHHREDGFKYKPTRSNIYWLVCDMVEVPAKVSALMGDWLVNGWCREAIFNLKLPMKKRYEEVSQILAHMKSRLAENDINVEIFAKQLYHDREEVTVHVRRFWAAVPGRRDERY
ncbi:23S rRNA (cytidine(2498)-2'-O)-methyltransferase RlmM [Rouxiella badensis]|jgi:23S rRNA (cytidine2498-2'-O)-methyltransferase|uniref:Ribosomal RNA large subunit methyltransferase M n=1 Tax=Rouxiella badensis TaxID=1646377 RepID=A0A1X0WEU4_9GAMM|nr:23S rRNA (cytidine(2498)-2'-O)-methyltransferase RlmM [Rouxiella badensis]MCC3719769.1 23S rRNA (cytidine(2498)-2'-O)-methyltransferase RlmM [Rouxiella badensis]MCC3729379.1 23S rRNA (cytidine(2498)-2'-O)-methyltransferase RlmM [Rouxiella badensis]MCC3734796.1 23S rRNA (cytidine(2498)-2'-O)-methyltransferase RlmM [Rouxiella badensis]MCC3741547.1 23S rRNA (cytidine(2498)-2'-O)-methyltransferase RlmM [Rouxiella badensis]MCC3749289.1 23S rRNA (cytidine(2498)-2'-O)-methyltransferase RlmM [Rouxi